jgi:hypothetical protein
MRQVARVGLVVAACLIGCDRAEPRPQAPIETRKAEELAWAREKAEAFLRTLIINPEDTDTLSWITGGNLDKDWWKGADGKENKTHYVKVLNKVGGPDGATGWEIKSEAIAPDKDETLFRGVVMGQKRSTGFTLAVGKEADGKWRVTAFSVEQAF